MDGRHRRSEFEDEAREYVWRAVARELGVARIDEADREELLREEPDLFPHETLVRSDTDGLNETHDFEGIVADLGARLRLMGVGAVTVPERWRQESERRLDDSESIFHQRQTLATFRLSEPLPLSELRQFVGDLLAEQVEEGTPMLLPLPDDSEFEAAHRYVYPGDKRSLQPLYVLACFAQEFSRRTGFTPGQAVGFLLCNERYVRPYITVKPSVAIRHDTRGDAPEFGFTIRVPSLDIRPDEVANAYREKLTQLRVPGLTRLTPAERFDALGAMVREQKLYKRGGKAVDRVELLRRWNARDDLHANDRFDDLNQLNTFIGNYGGVKKWGL